MKSAAQANLSDANRYAWLSHSALFLALALVIARACMMEFLRDSFSTSPGEGAIPRGAGAATSVCLDLLCAVPLLMVLLRRALDRSYRLALAWPQLFMGMLAGFAVASALWADDKFAALVGAFHFVSATTLFFAVSQVVRDWRRLRLVGAICFGLLLIYTADGLYYRFEELPALQAEWQKNHAEISRQRGWEEGSYQARQFALRIENGSMLGFNSSPNSYAAVIVLLSIISAGMAIQRLSDKEDAVLVFPILIAIPAAALVLYYTQSKAAIATLVLAIPAFIVLWLWGRQLAKHWKIVFFACVLFVIVGVAAVVSHGLYHHGLPTSSLDFRWKYWVASAQLFLTHPLRGIGWDNFGLHYLAHRLPEAPEEIKDPHNFLIRFIVELGAVGGALALGWLVSLGWALIKPSPDESHAPPDNRDWSPVSYIAALGSVAFLVNILASIDLSESGSFILVEVIKKVLFLCVFMVGTILFSLKSMREPIFDGRRASWVLNAILIAMGLFLIHNLIEFSFFEVGPMFLFALLAGSALGIQRGPLVQSEVRSNSLGAIAFAVAALLWLSAGILLVAPVVRAEQLAIRADDRIRSGQAFTASQELASAFDVLPYNWDYGNRAASAMIMARLPEAQIRAMLAKTIAANPAAINSYLLRAHFNLQQETIPDRRQVIDDYKTAIELNPNDVGIRLDYAATLEHFNQPHEALKQYQLALDYNDKLPPEESKRLKPARVEDLRRVIERLSAQ